MLDWEKFGMTEVEWKSLHKSKRWRLRNPGKQALATKRWADLHKEDSYIRARKSYLKIQYNLTEQDYQNMLSKQEGKCAICGTSKPTGKWKVFAVDHCHHTNEIRGLLCNECNRGMGLLGDSIERLQQALAYLRRTK